jgi:channel protein (hemolysin III family)
MDIDALPIPGFREPFSSISHLAGAVVFAVLGVVLVRRGRGSTPRMISLAVLGLSSVALLSLSGVYHMLDVGVARNVMKRLDIAGVFVLIAATITPGHMILFQGLARWAPIVLVWSVVATGVTLRMVFFDTFPGWLAMTVYLIFGWGGAIAALAVWRRHGLAFVRPLILGGLAYTVGAVVLWTRWPTLIPGMFGPHELWHVAVLVGLAFHWRFVFQFAGGIVRTHSGYPAEEPHRQRTPNDANER